MKQRLIRFIVRLRGVMPPWFDRALSRVLQSDSFLARKITGLFAVGEVVPTPVVPDEQASVRLLIAPFNYASQGYLWAEALNSSERSVSAVNYAVGHAKAAFPAHLTIPTSVFVGSQQWKLALRESLSRYTHVLIESFGSLYGLGTGPVILDEIAELQSRGIIVGLICHGSDIRSPKEFIARNPGVQLSDFGENVARLERSAQEGREVLRGFKGEVYITTPDLFHDVPGATWLPTIVDPEPWRTAAASFVPRGKRPVVLHAPTNAGIKGTADIERVCRELDAEGIIEYRAITGVPHDEMLGFIADADILIDQLLLGIYGVVALEAMAAEKVVISNLFPEVRNTVRATSGREVPIVQAEASTLRTVLVGLAENVEERKRVGAESAAFVEAVHSGGLTASVLGPFLNEGIKFEG